MKKKILIISIVTTLTLTISIIFVITNKKEETPTEEIITQQEYTPLEEIAEQLNQSSQLITQNNFIEARQMLTGMENNNNELVHYTIGITYMKERNYNEALKYFSQSIDIKPTISAYNNRAYCYKLLGKNEEALSDYTSIIELNRDFPNAFFERGKLTMHSNPEQAKKDFERAYQLGIESAKDFLNTL
jgi:tetratricopeptide (TPR) repeat protein